MGAWRLVLALKDLVSTLVIARFSLATSLASKGKYGLGFISEAAAMGSAYCSKELARYRLTSDSLLIIFASSVVGGTTCLGSIPRRV